MELQDITGYEKGIIKVVGFSHMKYNGERQRHGMSYWECECKLCGKHILIARSHLMQRKCIKHNHCEGKKYAEIV